MASNRSLRSLLAGTGLALIALVGAGTAQARGDVNWSLGISSPGVVVDVDHGRGVRVLPPSVYLAPAPPPPSVIYYPSAPQPVYYAPPVYVAPSPIYERHDRGRHHYQDHYRHHDRHHGHGYSHGYHDRRSEWDRR